MKRLGLLLIALVLGLVLGALCSGTEAACAARPCTTSTVTTTVPTTVTVTTTTPTTTAPTTTTTPPPPPPSDDEYGIAVGYPGVVRDFNGSRYDEYVSHLKSLGATVLRTDYSTGAGTTFQLLHDAARAQGLNVVPIIIGKSSWTTATAQTYANDLVARYPETRKVELGNEPNGQWSWGTTPNAASYANLIAAMAPILRAGLPGVTLISPGLAPYAGASGQVNAVDYQNSLIAAGIDQYVDCWGYHPYDDWSWNTQMPQMSTSLANAGISEPLCLTETGRDTYQYTEAAQAAAVTLRINEAQARADIADVFWYSLHDHCSSCTGKENRFGLFHTDWSEKPGAQAYRDALG